MSKWSRSKAAKPPKTHSPAYHVIVWVSSVLSVLLLWFIANAVISDLGSLRSCNGNSSGLSVASCGKQSLNPGDLILFGLFVLSACLTVSLFTMAWRSVRREPK